MEQRLRCLQLPSLSQRLCSAFGKPLLKGPVAFPVVAEAASPSGLDLLDLHLAFRPHRAAQGSITYIISVVPPSRRPDKGSVQCMDETTAAQRLQVILPRSDRARIGIQGEGTETLTHKGAAGRVGTSTGPPQLLTESTWALESA